MSGNHRIRNRLERAQSPSLRPWDPTQGRHARLKGRNAIVDCGWGRLIFGQTFDDDHALAETLKQEAAGKRDIAMYLRNPHVVISHSPQSVFLDPSHTYRLWLDRYRSPHARPQGFIVRLLNRREDARAVDGLYRRLHLVPPGTDFILRQRTSRTLTWLVAEATGPGGGIVGVVSGVDHVEAFDDPDNGSSLWALAIDLQAGYPGIGEALVRQLAEHYLARGRSYMDLSVMHDNEAAIALYEKLGFVRVPVFSLKRKNTYNEPLYTGSAPGDKLNPYAEIIVSEARRRGIVVEVLDEQDNYFALTCGGRTVVCRESLSEMTSAIAMSRCQDKSVTHRLLAGAGLRVPAQRHGERAESGLDFLAQHRRIVVKPACGEQGAGISVDVSTPEALREAWRVAENAGGRVLLEAFVEGSDLRIVVINYEVVAAALRHPAKIIGTGRHTIRALIDKQSRRRSVATRGESRIPFDDETRRCILDAGHTPDDLLPRGVELAVRKTANLHTGGTLEDVTARLSPALRAVAVRAARTLDIPVVGLDLLVSAVDGDDYVIVEANERPGLANHEPQPTAQRFIDLLFPHTAAV
jgi:GNAT-family acetyltransferase (TIGR03103 family)